jgi:hypothetical protein
MTNLVTTRATALRQPWPAWRTQSPSPSTASYLGMRGELSIGAQSTAQEASQKQRERAVVQELGGFRLDR